MEDAKKIIEEVKAGVVQKSASKKDEVTVMKALMNDSDFCSEIYDKKGEKTEYYPGRELRKVVANAVASTTKISGKEAAELVDNYTFNNADATAMIGLSKEFVYQYLQTGRKLPIGGRETSDVSLMWKEVAERTAGIPAGKDGGERSTKVIPAHGAVKVSAPCPKWVK